MFESKAKRHKSQEPTELPIEPPFQFAQLQYAGLSQEEECRLGAASSSMVHPHIKRVQPVKKHEVKLKKYKPVPMDKKHAAESKHVYEKQEATYLSFPSIKQKPPEDRAVEVQKLHAAYSERQASESADRDLTGNSGYLAESEFD